MRRWRDSVAPTRPRSEPCRARPHTGWPNIAASGSGVEALAAWLPTWRRTAAFLLGQRISANAPGTEGGSTLALARLNCKVRVMSRCLCLSKASM